MRRSRIPVRLTIHSSLVSRMADRSSLFSTAGGRHFPQPVIAARVMRRPLVNLSGSVCLVLDGFVRIAARRYNPQGASFELLFALAAASVARPGGGAERA